MNECAIFFLVKLHLTKGRPSLFHPCTLPTIFLCESLSSFYFSTHFKYHTLYDFHGSMLEFGMNLQPIYHVIIDY